ncbi:TRAM LAG1 CLN8 domain containing protein [Asbolus verrucosus]|uniref:TRAM LAG1 CLN8 domain containing protein n=1 Tax=Asbolus verrucosus TaxID=1661398 RepID=A0A482WAK4_ASBVE|nr:TRAM LAG1 CLN8 domain containing protein [Asbolus verrucosus]
MLSEDDAQTENSQFTFKFDSWYAILLSAVIWSLTYQLATFLLPMKSREYCCRVISFWHGVVSAFVGINQCFLIDTPFDHPEWRTTSSQKFLMVCSLGYFIHDLIWCFLYQRESKLMIAHHVYSVFALQRMLYKNNSGAQATCALGSMEITNPMLQIRWFLRSEGYYPSTLFTSVELTFMLLFFLVRIVLGTYFLVVIAFQPKNDWDFRILSVTIYIMSWIFMLNISKYFVNKYGGFGLHLDEIHNKGT